jgi:hypothetical protein
MLVVAFGNPGIPPPGFSIWRALRFTVRPRLARVAAGPPGMHQAGAGGRGHDRAVNGARHGGGLRPRQQDYRTASGAVIADGTPQAIKNDAEVQRA